jgi:hypothetical protein
MKPLRIAINALYLLPGGVGGTEIYLRQLLTALERVDQENEYLIFTNRETGRDLAPVSASAPARAGGNPPAPNSV